VECSAVFKIYRALFCCYGKYADSANPGGANWQVRAINAVTGNGVQETVFPRNGPALNPALFNQPGDNTIAIFMTPLNDTCKAAETKMGATKPTDLK
jgi:hypothetical protein